MWRHRAAGCRKTMKLELSCGPCRNSAPLARGPSSALFPTLSRHGPSLQVAAYRLAALVFERTATWLFVTRFLLRKGGEHRGDHKQIAHNQLVHPQKDSPFLIGASLAKAISMMSAISMISLMLAVSMKLALMPLVRAILIHVGKLAICLQVPLTPRRRATDCPGTPTASAFTLGGNGGKWAISNLIPPSSPLRP